MEGDCNGVYVTDKTAIGFTVKELQNGTSNVSFSWHIVANRKDEIDKTTGEKSIYANLRFPDAPSAIKTMPSQNIALKQLKEKDGFKKK